jgi:hypothetical protein
MFAYHGLMGCFKMDKRSLWLCPWLPPSTDSIYHVNVGQ